MAAKPMMARSVTPQQTFSTRSSMMTLETRIKRSANAGRIIMAAWLSNSKSGRKMTQLLCENGMTNRKHDFHVVFQIVDKINRNSKCGRNQAFPRGIGQNAVASISTRRIGSMEELAA
jgi:hypothetical protein